MPTETQPTVLDPITPQNAVLLIIDQQEGLFSRIFEPEPTRVNLYSLWLGSATCWECQRL